MGSPRTLRLALTLAVVGATIGMYGFLTATVLAKPAKVTVCHLDDVTGTYTPIKVADASAHLKHGDRVFDGALSGATIYANAWTELDGVPGYSGCDQLIAALVEASGDSDPGAGDTVRYGGYPTTLDGPFTFNAFPWTSRTVVEFCRPGNNGAVAHFTTSTEPRDLDFVGWSPDSRIDQFVLTHGFGSTGFSVGIADDKVLAFPDGITAQSGATTLVDVSTLRQGDQPFVDTSISRGC